MKTEEQLKEAVSLLPGMSDEILNQCKGLQDVSIALTTIKNLRTKLKLEKAQEPSKRFKSVAHWTKIKPSEDEHDTYEQAQSVCEMLITKWGLGRKYCPTRGVCLKAYVEEIKEVT